MRGSGEGDVVSRSPYRLSLSPYPLRFRPFGPFRVLTPFGRLPRSWIARLKGHGRQDRRLSVSRGGAGRALDSESQSARRSANGRRSSRQPALQPLEDLQILLKRFGADGEIAGERIVEGGDEEEVERN